MIIVVLAVIGVSFGTVTFFQNSGSEKIYVYNCGNAEYQPTSLTPFCADAGAGLVKITWTDSTSDQLRGIGRWEANDCEPSCVAGKVTSVAVMFTATKPLKDSGKTVMSRVDVETKGNEMLPGQKSSKFGWDLQTKPLT
jgi:hypothetical protein